MRLSLEQNFNIKYVITMTGGGQCLGREHNWQKILSFLCDSFVFGGFVFGKGTKRCNRKRLMEFHLLQICGY